MKILHFAVYMQCISYENKVILMRFKIFINVEYGHDKYWRKTAQDATVHKVRLRTFENSIFPYFK